MDRVRERYYKPVAYFLSAIGLWPFVSPKLRRIQSTFIFCTLTCTIASQFLPLITLQYRINIFLKNLSALSMSMGFIVKYNSFLYQIETVKDIMKQVQYDWKIITDNDEIEILKKHARVGRYYMKIFTVFLTPSTLILMMYPFVPIVMDVIVPLNESRNRQFPASVQCFLDEQEYFYLIALTMEFVLLIGGATFVGTESLYFMWLQHASSLFEIVRYRIQLAFSINHLEMDVSKKEYKIRSALTEAVKIHRRGTDFFNNLRDNFAMTYLLLTGFGVLSISINLFRLCRAILYRDENHDLLMALLFVISEFGYMYYLNFIIQRVLDSYNDIFQELYNTEWYEAPVPVQKQLLFIMLRSIKVIAFDMFGVCNFSIEGFSVLTRLCISYFMTIYSLS